MWGRLDDGVTRDERRAARDGPLTADVYLCYGNLTSPCKTKGENNVYFLCFDYIVFQVGQVNIVIDHC